MQSILDARLINVGGRIYRSTADLSTYAVGAHAKGRVQQSSAANSHLDEEAYREEDEGDDFAIQQEGDTFLLRLKVENAVVGFLIGTKGSTKARMEQETGVKININSKSRNPSDTADVVIKAGSRQAVASAANRVNILLDSILRGNRLEYTHFVSIPLATPELQAKFQDLKAQILGDPSSAAAGIEESIFVDPRKLHLTIAMLKLYTEDRRQAAIQVLQQLRAPIKAALAGKDLRVRLRRHELMNDDPSAAHVLYLGVESASDSSNGLDALKSICSDAVAAFDKAGLLLPKDSREVKLHVTVMNTRHRMSAVATDSGRQGTPEPRRPFDARGIVQTWGNADFGDVTLSHLELSQRGRVESASGYYQALARIALE